MLSHEYIVSIAVVLVGLLQLFGVVVAQDVVVGLIVGILGLYGAFRRHSKGDITVLGARK
jgi:hypothetical protein